MNYYQSKNRKQRSKIKQLLYKAIGKCRFKTPRKLRHRSCGFNCTGKMGMDNFGCLNSSFVLFLLCKEPAKKSYVLRTLTAETEFNNI